MTKKAHKATSGLIKTACEAITGEVNKKLQNQIPPFFLSKKSPK